MTEQWKVSFRGCDIHWAATHEHVLDYSPLWDRIPWNPRLTERVTDDEASARDQYATLARWSRDKTQPVRDVTLSRSTEPTWIALPEVDDRA